MHLPLFVHFPIALPCRGIQQSRSPTFIRTIPTLSLRITHYPVPGTAHHTSCRTMTINSCDSECAIRIARCCRRHRTTRIAGRWLRRRFLPTCASAPHGHGRCCRALSAVSWESYRVQQATGERVRVCVWVWRVSRPRRWYDRRVMRLELYLLEKISLQVRTA